MQNPGVFRGLSYRRIIALICGALVSFKAAGAWGSATVYQPERFYIESWKTERGLPHNMVLALLQDHEGYIWIGTRFGVARFDGVRITQFNSANTAAMTSENCQVLAEDSEGSLWIGTSEGLLRRKNNRFVRYSTEQGLCDNSVRSLSPCSSGGMWIGTARGFCLFKDGQFTIPFDVKREPPANTEVLEDSSGFVWFNTQTNLYRASLASSELQWIAAVEPRGGNRPHFLFEEKTGKIWFGNYLGLFCWQNGNLSHFLPPTTNTSNVEYLTRVDEGFRTSSGEFWTTVSINRVLHLFEGGKFVPFRKPDGETIEDVSCFLEDREGSLWIGTKFDGLLRLRTRFIHTITTRHGLNSDHILSVCEAQDGKIWIGGSRNSFSRISNDRVESFRIDGTENLNVRCILEDRQQNLWLGMATSVSGNCLYRMSPNGQPKRFADQAGIRSPVVEALYQDRSGRIWIGTPNGLTCYHQGTSKTFTTRDGLSDNDVRAVLEDRAGNIWIGTDGGGLNVYSGGTFKAFRPSDGLPSDLVWALHEDSDGTLWVGTADGLSRYKDGHFVTLKREHGLFDDLVNCILEDNSKNLWISCNRGIYQVSLADLNAVADGKKRSIECFSYGENDGMASSETNGEHQPAGWKGRDGRLWFPTIKGVAVIDPAKVQRNHIPPPVWIEEVSADREVEFGTGIEVPERPVVSLTRRIRQEANAKNHIRLGAGRARVLEIHYAANSFVAPEKVLFKYRLKGHDDHWHFDRSRVAYFTNLKPRDYLFEVIACNNDGVWNPSPASMAISIAPQPSQTYSFFLFCGLLGAVGVVGAHQFRVHLLRRLQRLEKLNAVASERSRIARDMHDDLGANLTRLSLLADTGGSSNGPPAGYTARLGAIGDATRNILRSLDEIIWTTSPRHDSLESLVSYMGKHASEFFKGSHVACRLDIPIEMPLVPVSAQTRHDLFLVVKEAIANVAKHSDATEMLLQIRWTEPKLEIVIRDNGKGMPGPNALKDPGADGLRNMEARIHSLGGVFWVDGSSGTGTQVQFSVPIPDANPLPVGRNGDD